MITVLEVDQWTSTGNLRTIPWGELIAHGIGQISGGDSEAIRQIGIGKMRVYDVTPGARPSIGSVWFTQGEDGFPKFYLSNYDSSD